MNKDELYGRLPIPLQNLACTFAGRQRFRSRFTTYFDRVLANFEASGNADLKSLYGIQQIRLIELANRARRVVPHYRALNLPEFSVEPDAQNGIAQVLSVFPILEKADYRADPESFVAEDLAEEQLRKGKTSGTTGTALPLWYTPNALAEEYACVWRLRRRNGARLRNPHFTFGGQQVVPHVQNAPPFWRRNSWSNQVLFSLYHMSADNLPRYVDAMHEIPADYVEGYPSSIHLIARAMLESGRQLPKGRLKGIFPSSESLLAFHRSAIEEAFNAPVLDRYGTSEFAVSMTGCTAGNLHLDMEFGAVEIDVQEETDDFVRGPLLVTGFANDATPFLRYRIGDVGTRSKRTCPCGRPGEVFLDIDGRIEDYIVTPDGRWIGRMDHIFKEQLAVAEAQILQEDASGIEILVVPRANFGDEAKKALLFEVRSRLGREIRVELKLVEEIPREANGKFRAVKSAVGRHAR